MLTILDQVDFILLPINLKIELDFISAILSSVSNIQNALGNYENTMDNYWKRYYYHQDPV